jgi:hypothetical protein
MIDLDAIRERQLKTFASPELISQSAADCHALLAYVDELKRDAERYRWLRATGCSESEIQRRCSIFEVSYDDYLDAVIDAELGQL